MPDGTPWDLSIKFIRDKALALIETDDPEWVIAGPPCTQFSTLNNINPLSSSYTSNGETWTCTVTPNDGSIDGNSAFDSQTILDITAPDIPILDSIHPYQNENILTISGTTEPSSIVTIYKDCSSGLSSNTVVANKGFGIIDNE